MTKPNPPLSIVKPGSSGVEPMRPLGQHGRSLWDAIQSEYAVTDTGGAETLLQACSAVDRIEALSERIAADGEITYVKGVPKAHPALREEVALRSFICRALQRLGLNVEAVKPVGRPLSGGHGWRGD
ncbi:hypothetical protein [Bradyrhizobium diazoefficiens]